MPEELYTLALGGALDKNADLVKAALEKGLTVEDDIGSADESLLHIASRSGDAQSVKLLLQHGWDRFINAFAENTCTPLMFAASAGALDVIEVLISFGADVNAHDVDHIGNTALREVVETADTSVVELLLRAGADPTIRGWVMLNSIDVARQRLAERHDEESERILVVLENYSSNK